MTIPKQVDIELPLLHALRQLGGRAQPRDVYAVLEQHFVELTEADKAERLESGGSRWQNRVQFARQNLVIQGLVDPSERGVWKLTADGDRRAQQQGRDEALRAFHPQPNDSCERHHATFPHRSPEP